jgi:hypothetical protein
VRLRRRLVADSARIENATALAGAAQTIYHDGAVPMTTPPGMYLLRVEQSFASSERGRSQWFVNCAHGEVVGRASFHANKFYSKCITPGVILMVDVFSKLIPSTCSRGVSPSMPNMPNFYTFSASRLVSTVTQSM